MSIFAPVLAKGKDKDHTVSSLTQNTSTTTIVLATPATPIVVGDHVFLSDADGTLAEYLGKALTVAGSTITTSLRAQRTRASGAPVWTPEVSWQAASMPSAGNQPSRLPGIEIFETQDTVPLRTR